MPDEFVTVATYHRSFEARLAKNLLENEGIESMLSGELTADVLPLGQGGGIDQIVLRVHENDAQRATGILAVVAAAKLDEDWEEQAESAGVWTCSICGEPISNRLSICYACQTPRDAIRNSAPHNLTAIQPDLANMPTGEEVQKREEITHTPSPMPVVAETTEPEETTEPSTASAIGDDLARHAFGAAFFGLLTVILLPISWYYLAQLLFFSGELSPKGLRHFYGALLVNGLFVLIAIIVCAGGIIPF